MKKTIFISAVILLALTQCKKEDTDLTKTIVGKYYNSTQGYYISVTKKTDQTASIVLYNGNNWGLNFDSATITSSTTFLLNNGDTTYGQQWNDSVRSYTTYTGSGYLYASDLIVNVLQTTYNSDSANSPVKHDSTSYSGLIQIVQ